MENELNLNEIKEQVKRVISYSQDMNNPKVDKLINIWYNNKKDIYDIFNHKLILESDSLVEVDMEQDEIDARIEKFLDDIFNRGYPSLHRFVLLNKNHFCENIVPEDYITLNGIKIPKGMKITKAFKFFVDDKEELDIIQTMASRIIQEKKITGYLCLSIHPLDYLSSAESTYNWRSCHALDGEHRAGNLSYMLDKSTIVCYLRGEHETKLPHFPSSVSWNSKKWRMLLHLSDNYDAMFAGRHYPFFSKSLMIKVKKMFVASYLNSIRVNEYYYYPPVIWSKWHNDDITTAHFKVNNEDDFSTITRFIPMNHWIYPINKLVTDTREPLHFNDILYSSVYEHPYYAWRESSNGGDIHFTIGHSVPCLCCERYHISDPSMMICSDCDTTDYITCEFCGERIPEDEAIWIDEREMYVCRDCYESMDEEDL